MSHHKKYKLLNKMTVLFLVLMVAAFGISSAILIFKANKHIEKSVETSFLLKQEHFVKKIIEGKPEESFGTIKVQKLGNEKEYITRPDRDTLIMEAGARQLYRLREAIIHVNNETYLLVLKKNIDDFTRLKADIIKTLIPAFIIISLIILILNTFLSRYLFRPFNYILNQMKRFRVGENYSFQSISTSTSEFYDIQELFEGMIKRAEEDYVNLKEYTENMSHEFQTPLAIIRNKTENLIADENVMDKHAKSVKAIYDEANHLSKLGNTLKLLTKIENNEFVNKERIATQSVIEIHIDKLSELAGLKSIKIEANLNASHSFEIDPLLLEIILKNLIRNAILYADIDSIIHIETTSESLNISNHSESKEGIPTDLFKRFSKGKGNKSSLGLGLAIVKKICDLNGLYIKHNFTDSTHSFIISPSK